MNSKSHSADSGSVTGKFLRRTAVTVAGLAMVVGGFMASSPARADVPDLGVSAVSGTTAKVNVSNCSANSAGATYRVDSSSGTTVTPETPVTGWNQQNDFTFTVSGLSAGEYTVHVNCLGYSGGGDQIGSASFTITSDADAHLSVSPKAWKSGAPVTLTATGLPPGHQATFAFGYLGHVTAAEWSSDVDATGKASVTVTLPETDQGQPLPPGDYQVWVYTDIEGGPFELVDISLGANSQWQIGTGGDSHDHDGDSGGHDEGSSGSGGSLPKTGN